jgi:large subunit ribosomal protein L19
MESVIKQVEAKFKKPRVVDVRSGDTVRVHQKIREGSKERVQVFQGLVIRTDRKNSPSSRITVRRVSSGVGVEKSFLMHSPTVVKIEVVKRSKVRRKYLSYMRERTGKSARLSSVAFDQEQTNAANEVAVDDAPAAETKEAAAEDTAPESVEGTSAEKQTDDKDEEKPKETSSEKSADDKKSDDK